MIHSSSAEWTLFEPYCTISTSNVATGNEGRISWIVKANSAIHSVLRLTFGKQPFLIALFMPHYFKQVLLLCFKLHFNSFFPLWLSGIQRQEEWEGEDLFWCIPPIQNAFHFAWARCGGGCKISSPIYLLSNCLSIRFDSKVVGDCICINRKESSPIMSRAPLHLLLNCLQTPASSCDPASNVQGLSIGGFIVEENDEECSFGICTRLLSNFHNIEVSCYCYCFCWVSRKSKWHYSKWTQRKISNESQCEISSKILRGVGVLCCTSLCNSFCTSKWGFFEGVSLLSFQSFTVDSLLENT